MTFRDCLKGARLEGVLDALAGHKDGDLPERAEAYRSVIAALLALPPSPPPDANPIVVAFGGGGGCDAHLRNLQHVAPPEGLQPWGCDEGETPPEGFYNANDSRYSACFGMGLTPRTELIDRPVLVEAGTAVSTEQIAAELLWETTFYGFGDEEVAGTLSELKKTVEGIRDGTIPTHELDLDDI
jgi:hypothetical protein